MRYTIRAQLTASLALIVCTVIAPVSLLANILITRQFQTYRAEQQEAFAAGLAESLETQYDPAAGWNLDYIHGFGMYALQDGYIIRVYDAGGLSVWDAENHDMAFCHQVMAGIQTQLDAQRVHGEMRTLRYALQPFGADAGYADISFYSPGFSGQNEFQFLHALNAILIAVGLAALAFALLAGAVLARRIAAPLSAVTSATREIADGYYDRRPSPAGSAEEVRELCRAVDDMARTLEQQELLRRRLTTNVAHELRTPVANISAQLENTMEGVWNPTPERLRRWYGELQRITDLIGDVEELSRLEN